jgi:GR25 family glycosyltransferase involved in LPS biosynthesis
MKYKKNSNNLLYILLFLIVVLIIVLIKNKYKEPFENSNITIAYVINLKERTDRKNTIIEKFKNTSIRLEFINAVRSEKGQNGNIGLGESYKYIIRSHRDLPFILIFEDDCMPLDNFDERWKITKKWLESNPNEWETFGGGTYPKEWVKLKLKLENNINLFTSGKAFFTHFTYINSSAYDKILKYDYDKHGPIDHYINNDKYFKFIAIYPFLAFQESGQSDITNNNVTHTYDDSIFKNKLN